MNAIDPGLAEAIEPDGLTLQERTARDMRTNAFLASEAFVPFVLECFARAVEDVAAEHAALSIGPKHRS